MSNRIEYLPGGGFRVATLSTKEQAVVETFTVPGKKLVEIDFINNAVKLTFDDNSTLEFNAVGPAGSKLQMAYSTRISGKVEV